MSRGAAVLQGPRVGAICAEARHSPNPESSSVPMLNVMVTGASRGIGLAISLRLAAAGYRVLGVSRTTSPTLLPHRTRPAPPASARIEHIAFDLAQIEQIHDLVRDARKAFGSLHGLINNAATGTDGLLAIMHNRQIDESDPAEHQLADRAHQICGERYDGRGGGRDRQYWVDHRLYRLQWPFGLWRHQILDAWASRARWPAKSAGSASPSMPIAPGFMDTEMTKQLDDDQREQVARRSALRRLPEPRTWRGPSNSCSATAAAISPAR